jgi:hypothetical protein
MVGSQAINREPGSSKISGGSGSITRVLLTLSGMETRERKMVIISHRVIESVIKNGAKRRRWLSSYRVSEKFNRQTKSRFEHFAVK